MFKKFKIMAAMIVMLALVTGVAFAGYDHYTIDVRADQGFGLFAASSGGQYTQKTTNITYKVLTAGSDTSATLYSDRGLTSKTNPVTTTVFATDGKIDFYIADSSTSVDIMITDVDGMYSLFLDGATSTGVKTAIIDERPGIPHVGVIWFAHTTTNAVDTGVNFKYDSLINDVRVEVVETCAACTIDVGLLSTETSGDADGLRDGTLTTTAGFVADTGIITAGSTIDYVPDSTYGALLYTIIGGSDAVATVGGRSYLGHVVTGANARSLTYTVDSTTSGEGYIYSEHIRLR